MKKLTILLCAILSLKTMALTELIKDVKWTPEEEKTMYDSLRIFHPSAKNESLKCAFSKIKLKYDIKTWISLQNEIKKSDKKNKLEYLNFLSEIRKSCYKYKENEYTEEDKNVFIFQYLVKGYTRKSIECLYGKIKEKYKWNEYVNLNFTEPANVADISFIKETENSCPNESHDLPKAQAWDLIDRLVVKGVEKQKAICAIEYGSSQFIFKDLDKILIDIINNKNTLESLALKVRFDQYCGGLQQKWYN